MQPVCTPAALADFDRELIVAEQLESFIERAAQAALAVAREMMGGLYGRRMLIIAGPGHNGDDGRRLALIARRRGAQAVVIDVRDAPRSLPTADLVVDAAFGTGFHGNYAAPLPAPGTKVLSIDIPSGVNAATGEACEGAVIADRTITFVAHKPGLLFRDGPSHAGAIIFADLGVTIADPMAWIVEEDLPGSHSPRPRTAHKWRRALFVVAGSPGMTGAATLCALGAMRAGASMVRIGAPGVAASDYGPIEAVAHALPTQGLYRAIEDELHRCSALIVGPGLGRSPHRLADVRELLLKTTLPVVIDADALYALDSNTVPFAGDREVVMTPHEGELAHLLGHSVGADPLGEAAELARRSGATVLRKGPVTVIARSGITPLLITSGTSALATAGTGDVLSGVVGALMARGLDSVTASALGAYVHGRAGANAPMEGLIASDLPPLIANELAEHSRHQIRDR